MAVTVQGQAYFTPIFRPAELVNTPLIGRWHGLLVGAGDGSGGSITLQLLMNGIPSIFGSHSLLSVEFVNIWVEASVAPTYNQWYWQFNEPTTGYTVISGRVIEGSVYGTIDQAQRPFGQMLFRVGQDRSSADIIYAETNNAATTTSYRMVAGGFIFDERYLISR